MDVFEAELDIKEEILASLNSVVSASVGLSDAATMSDAAQKSIEDIKQSDSALKEVMAALEKHPSLLYGSAVLVSTVMNLNDDIFIPSETWAARKTPINTPYNENHEKKHIIGHIISSEVMSKDGQIVTEQPADFFDIAVGFVMYKHIYPDLAEEIVTKAQIGEKFVSMECVISNFDFGIVEVDGSLSIIKRNKDTAFLTKYLRRFGGTGKYNGKRIGRVLRGIRFTGMGDVNQPANPRSEYLVLANINENLLYENIAAFKIEIEGNIMEIKTLEDAQKVIADLNTKLSDLQKQLEASQGSNKTLTDEIATLKTSLEAATTKEAELTKSVTDLTAQVKTLNESTEAEKAKITVAEQKISDLNKEVEATKSELATAKDELNKIHAAEKLQARVKTLTDAKVEVTDELKAKVAQMSDEIFATVIEFSQKMKKAPEVVVEGPNGTDVTAAADNSVTPDTTTEALKKVSANLRKKTK